MIEGHRMRPLRSQFVKVCAVVPVGRAINERCRGSRGGASAVPKLHCPTARVTQRTSANVTRSANAALRATMWVANEAVDHSPVVPVRKAWRDGLVTLGARFIPRCRGCRRVWCVGSKVNGPVPRQQSKSDSVYHRVVALHICSSKAHAPWSRWLLFRNLRKPLDRYVRDRRRVVTISTTCPVSARKCFRPTRRRIAQDATSFLRI